MKWDRCIKELKKVFKQVKESETFKDKVAFEECEDSAFAQFMIEPSLSVDEMKQNLRWYFDECISCDDWNIKESVEKYICQTYLTAVGKEITEKDLMTQLSLIKNMIMQIQQEQNMGVVKADCISVNDSINSKMFRKLFDKPLFWDKHIKLRDVYIEPNVENTTESGSVYVKKFLEQREYNMLVIEGLPGIGKSIPLNLQSIG